jgi:hypothetical protein
MESDIVTGARETAQDAAPRRAHRGRSTGAMAVAVLVASLLAACAQGAPFGRSTSADPHSGATSPRGYGTADPYHYNCTGECLSGAGG